MLAIKLSLVLVLGVTSSATSLGQARKFATQQETTPTVDFCDLTVHPKRYVGKLVRVKASLTWWWESSYLYDPSCETKDKKLSNAIDCSGRANCKELNEKIWNAITHNEQLSPLAGAYRSDLTIVGRLVGPRKRGYGHLGSFKFEFRIRDVESASQVMKLSPKP